METKKEAHYFSWMQIGSLALLLIIATWTLFAHMTQEGRSTREDIKNQSARTDRLYEMFYEVVKERK